MKQASRAIVLEGDKILVMFRQKYGSNYYTLVGGGINDGETPEQALIREVQEETGMQVTSHQLVYVERHPEPYAEQYIFLCQVAPHQPIAIQELSEEGAMNKHQANIHTPMWAHASSFAKLPFRTPQLQSAIVQALKKGFPKDPVEL